MKDENLVRFFECIIPVTICNLKCDYCYVIQRNNRNMKKAELKFSAEHIGKCLTKERLGGKCYFSLCGAGETLAQPEIVDIAYNILKQGHIVNITTNGTMSKVFEKFKDIEPKLLKQLHFSFSFHYLELKRLNKLDAFFQNIDFVKNIGCSYMVQINLTDSYLPYLEEIKKICIENVGAMPQVAATRKESKGFVKVDLHTSLSKEEYEKIGKEFESPLFEYTMKNFNVKRKEFCYAGDRSGCLNIATGALKKCYGDPLPQYIFDDPNKPIKFEPVGNNCYSKFCFNSSHFISLGVIDNLDNDITYSGLRDRKEVSWFNDSICKALSEKLIGNNVEYKGIKKLSINIKNRIKKIIIIIISRIRSIKK